MVTQSPEKNQSFVVATPARSVCDDFARFFQKQGLLRLYAIGTRRHTQGIDHERTRLFPIIGAMAYIAAKTLSPYRAEWFRSRLHPLFDSWVKLMLKPGDHLLSSYGYVNESFKWVRRHGGKTFLDAGNSHPENYWEVVSEEHRRWNCPYPALPPHWCEQSKAMMEHVDYLFSPSTYVTNSFLARGFSPSQILPNIYPIDLHCFTPPVQPRPKTRPLRVICTGSLNLRKGIPYLLEAFVTVLRHEPQAQLLLSGEVTESLRPIFAKYQHLPIDWAPNLPHPQLAGRLRSADIFVLPSLEDGFGLTVAEAMACGLPVVVTPNTGSADLVNEGVNGSVVPIRNAAAIADAILSWWTKIQATEGGPSFDKNIVSRATFERKLQQQLSALLHIKE